MYADGKWWAFSPLVCVSFFSFSSSSINHFFFLLFASLPLSLALSLFNVSRLLHGNSSWLTITQINLSATSLSCPCVMSWLSKSWEDRVLGRSKRRTKWSCQWSISPRTIKGVREWEKDKERIGRSETFFLARWPSPQKSNFPTQKWISTKRHSVRVLLIRADQAEEYLVNYWLKEKLNWAHRTRTAFYSTLDTSLWMQRRGRSTTLFSASNDDAESKLRFYRRNFEAKIMFESFNDKYNNAPSAFLFAHIIDVSTLSSFSLLVFSRLVHKQSHAYSS